MNDKYLDSITTLQDGSYKLKQKRSVLFLKELSHRPPRHHPLYDMQSACLFLAAFCSLPLLLLQTRLF